MTDVQTMVSEAIQEMEEDQKELQQKIKYVKDFDFSVPVTEEQWHQICETPLRWTDVMAHLVKNRFPNAEHIKVTANDVVFDLEGFSVRIPTSRTPGINVDTSWYYKKLTEPEIHLSPALKSMKRYFELLDSGKASWYELARARINRPYSKGYLFLVWHLCYKWKNPKRELFDQLMEKAEENHKKAVRNYYETNAKMKEKAKKLLKDVLPQLDAFSKTHGNYYYSTGFSSYTTVDDIKELEGDAV